MAAVEARFAVVSLAKGLLHQVLEEVARVGVVRERAPPRELSKKEQEARRRAEAKLDQMITIMDRRIPDKPNEEKLEIFQKLSKMTVLEEFSLDRRAMEGIMVRHYGDPDIKVRNTPSSRV